MGATETVYCPLLVESEAAWRSPLESWLQPCKPGAHTRGVAFRGWRALGFREGLHLAGLGTVLSI